MSDNCSFCTRGNICDYFCYDCEKHYCTSCIEKHNRHHVPEDSECNICYDDLSGITYWKRHFKCSECNQWTCSNCIGKHIMDNVGNNIVCPNCNYQLSVYDIHGVLDNRIKNYFKKLNEFTLMIERETDYQHSDFLLLMNKYENFHTDRYGILRNACRKYGLPVKLNDSENFMLVLLFYHHFRDIRSYDFSRVYSNVVAAVSKLDLFNRLITIPSSRNHYSIFNLFAQVIKSTRLGYDKLSLENSVRRILGPFKLDDNGNIINGELMKNDGGQMIVKSDDESTKMTNGGGQMIVKNSNEQSTVIIDDYQLLYNKFGEPIMNKEGDHLMLTKYGDVTVKPEVYVDYVEDALKFSNNIVMKIEKKIEVFKYKCQLCPGVLNNQYKCSLCETKFCGKCFEKYDSKHECKQSDIENIKLIKKETKPCPKCYERIFRISGCAQMFCTGCHISFDWNTGEIVRQNFHNPHRADWLQQNRGIVEVFDGVCGLTFPTTSNYYKHLQMMQEINELLARDSERVYINKRRHLRLKFLTNLITEKEYHKAFVSLENGNRYRLAVTTILQQYHDILQDLLYTAKIRETDDFLPLIQYAEKSTNELLTKISKDMFNRNRVTIDIVENASNNRGYDRIRTIMRHGWRY